MTAGCSADAVLDVAGSILEENSYGFLGTVDDGVALRLVHHLSRGGLDVIWIGTSPVSRKAAAIDRTARATYAVEDRTRYAYVSLQCSASIVTDAHTLERHWVPTLEPFFPAGPLGGDFALICLRPRRLELMSFADGIHPDPYGLRAMVAQRAGGSWTL